MEGKDWINITERKPDYGICVLIHLHNGMITTAYRVKTGKNETTWFVYNDNMRPDEVLLTHWMPLPKPPGEI